MTKLIILRGLPGSGKTSFAHEYFKEQFDSGNLKVMIVSRDDLRGMQGLSSLPTDYESNINLMHHNLVKIGLKKRMTVIVADCNLKAQYVKDLAEIGIHCGAEIEVKDFDTPIDECIRRDKSREAKGQHVVGENVIRGMHKRYFTNGKFPANPLVNIPAGVKLEPYKRNIAMRKAKIYDIDGTLADSVGVRSPYDYTKVHLDKPHSDVIQQMRDDYDLDYALIVLSGREDSCRPDTERWLREETGLPIGSEIPVYMRKTDDSRADYIIKYEMFMQEIAPYYNVVGIYDDRDQVVRLWRDIGVRCYQVNYGDF
jgi:predicted kinase